MNIRTTLLTALLATPLHAGGPVIIETEEPPIADVRPQGDGGKWVVPVIVGVGLLFLLSRGGSDGGSDCTCTSPEDGGSGCGC